MSVIVIAEAGVNHNGDLARARDMVFAAAECGADYVKFQCFRADDLVSVSAEAAPYQQRNTSIISQAELLQGLEISSDGFSELADACRKARIKFLCTPFEVAQTAFLISLGMDRIKVASSELTHTAALEAFGATGLPTLLSTGMADLTEVATALGVLRRCGAPEVTLLQCTSIYPALPAMANLRAMVLMRDVFRCPVGYSDHTLGDHVALAAVALGATVVEKHFTLSRELSGPDHRASLEVPELAAMIVRMREIEEALGEARKEPDAEEVATARLVRRSWHATRDLAPGTVLAPGDAALKRPAAGLPPARALVGRRLALAVRRGEPIREDHLA